MASEVSHVGASIYLTQMRSLPSRLFSNRRYKTGVYVLSNTAAGRRQPFYEWSKRERFDYTKKAAPIGAEFNKQLQKRLAHSRRVEGAQRALGLERRPNWLAAQRNRWRRSSRGLRGRTVALSGPRKLLLLRT